MDMKVQDRTDTAAHRGMASASAALSVFDLDRTLTILPTYTRFLLFAARRLAPWRLLLTPLLLLPALPYAAGLIARRTMKQAMHRALLGKALPRADAVRIADLFADSLAADGFYAEGVALIEAERRAGRRILLATAAPHFYAEAIARRLGIDDIVATASSWRGEQLLPEIDGANCYGAEKCRRVLQFMASAGLARDAVHLRVYSDHASDLPLFELGDEAVAVNPSAKLRAIAAAHGWAILDWRR